MQNWVGLQIISTCNKTALERCIN